MLFTLQLIISVRILCKCKLLLHHWLLLSVPLCARCVGILLYSWTVWKTCLLLVYCEVRLTKTPSDREPTALSYQSFCGRWPWTEQGTVNISACRSYSNELALYTFKSTCFHAALLPFYYPTVLTFTAFPQSLPYKAKRFFLVNLRQEFQ